jgi:hypothetical protein
MRLFMDTVIPNIVIETVSYRKDQHIVQRQIDLYYDHVTEQPNSVGKSVFQNMTTGAATFYSYEVRPNIFIFIRTFLLTLMPRTNSLKCGIF